MNKKSCEDLILKLADKTLSFGCRCEVNMKMQKTDDGKRVVAKNATSGVVIKTFITSGIRSVNAKTKGKEVCLDGIGRFDTTHPSFMNKGHPVNLRRVLIVSHEKTKDMPEYRAEMWHKIITLWFAVNEKLDKSLNEICKDSGFEKYREYDSGKNGVVFGDKVEQLKDPSARALFEFLGDIFN